jgi:hypothetical protein
VRAERGRGLVEVRAPLAQARDRQVRGQGVRVRRGRGEEPAEVRGLRRRAGHALEEVLQERTEVIYIMQNMMIQEFQYSMELQSIHVMNVKLSRFDSSE